MMASILLILIFASWAIDRDYLNDKRIMAQRASDMAALAGGWEIAQTSFNAGTGPGNTVTTTAENESKLIAEYNNYDMYSGTPDPNVTVTINYPAPSGSVSSTGVTTPGPSDYDHYQVVVSRKEPIFFGAVYGHPYATVSATSTVLVVSPNAQDFSNTWYGRVGGPFNFAAYGPQDGADRGDALDVTTMAIDGNFPSGQSNPDYSPWGEIFKIKVPNTYLSTNSSRLGSNPMVQVSVFDPELYDATYWNSKTTVDNNGRYDEQDHMPSGNPPGTEKWEYSLWSGDPRPTADGGTTNGVATEIAWADYSESSTSTAPPTNNMWVTPGGAAYNPAKPTTTTNSFIFDAANYGWTATSGATYYMFVTSDNGTNGIASGNPGNGVGYDENGYLVRAAPPDPTGWDTSSGATASEGSAASSNDLVLNPYSKDTVDKSTLPYYNQTYDFAWAYLNGYASSLTNSAGGSVSTPNASSVTENGITMQVLDDASINCNATSGAPTVPIYFGYASPAPTGQPLSISFYGFDEDSGASNITYQCDSILDGANPVVFQGALATDGGCGYTTSGTTTTETACSPANGNGAWSVPETSTPLSPTSSGTVSGGDANGASNTIVIPSSFNYTGGNWTADYTTGGTDNTTWYWTVSSNDTTTSGAVKLIDTSSTAVF
jgi:hypothetical protein